MTLIKSISGIRGTIGGGAGEGLNPLDIVKFTSAYATLIRKTCKAQSNKIVVGRDARISGEMVKNVVVGTLMGMGWDVVDIDLASTPTTELAVTMEGACGGIILTASHNPKQWNALKLLNEHGEFLNAEEGNEVLRIAEAEEFDYEEFEIEVSGKYISNDDESMIRMALNGTGIIQHLDFAIAEHINAGKLQPILEDWAVSFPGFYIYVSSRVRMPSKVRAFIDFMVEKRVKIES